MCLAFCQISFGRLCDPQAGSNAEEAWLDISYTLFWKGYDIWCARQKLVKRYWSEIAPNDWNKRKKKNNRKRKKKANQSYCTDPFHFLQRCDNSSKEKPTRCECSEFQRPRKRMATKDIRDFITKFPTLKPLSAFELKRTINKKSLKRHREESSSTRIQNRIFETQSDLIRGQHDRGKRRKCSL